jgi:hypothetical protein
VSLKAVVACSPTLPVAPTSLNKGSRAAVAPAASNPILNLLPRRLAASSLPDRPMSLDVMVGPPPTKSPMVVVPSEATIKSVRPAAPICLALTADVLRLRNLAALPTRPAALRPGTTNCVIASVISPTAPTGSMPKLVLT